MNTETIRYVRTFDSAGPDGRSSDYIENGRWYKVVGDVPRERITDDLVDLVYIDIDTFDLNVEGSQETVTEEEEAAKSFFHNFLFGEPEAPADADAAIVLNAGKGNDSEGRPIEDIYLVPGGQWEVKDFSADVDPNA